MGPLLYLYMTFYLLVLFVWNGRERNFFMVLFLLNISAFLIIELKFPDTIKPYDLERTRLLDVYLSYFLFIALSGSILMFAKTSYAKEKKKAEQSDHLKSAFLANMSHEIRTPMNAILGFTQLLHRDLPKVKRDEFLNVIQDNSQSLLRLIEDIIDISKIEAGELTLKMEHCNLNSIINEIASNYKQELTNYPNKKLDIVVDVPKDGLIMISDPTRIKQILINMVSNSFKYTEEGTLTISYQLVSNWVRFKITDTGTGIKKEHLNEIFDRFRKIETDESYKIQQGTGIGLSITKNLVRMLGGEVGVESVYGEGSEFHFTLPYIPVEVKLKAKDTLSKVDTPHKIDFKDKLFLVAEDERTNFEFLKKVLERNGAKVIHAKNGEEAVKLCEQNENIDLILMDIMMPIMNGYDAAIAIKELNSKIKILAQTALAMEGDAERVLSSGCDDYISKPVRIKELLRKVHGLLEK